MHHTHCYFIGCALVFSSFVASADVCPAPSTFKHIGHYVFAQDSSKRKLHFDNFSGALPLVAPYEIAFTGAKIFRHTYSEATGRLECDYIYTASNHSIAFALADFRSADANAFPVGKNWLPHADNPKLVTCTGAKTTDCVYASKTKR